MTTFGIIFFVVVVTMMIVYVSPVGRDMRNSNTEPHMEDTIKHPDSDDDRIPF